MKKQHAKELLQKMEGDLSLLMLQRNRLERELDAHPNEKLTTSQETELLRFCNQIIKRKERPSLEIEDLGWGPV